MKRNPVGSATPKVYVGKAGPSRRTADRNLVSPRKGSAQRKGTASVRTNVAPNTKNQGNTVLNRLSCMNENMIGDVVNSVGKPMQPQAQGKLINGTSARPTVIRSNSAGVSRTITKKIQGEVLGGSYNSVGFKQQLQQCRQQSAVKRDVGKAGQKGIAIKTTEISSSPNTAHHVHRLSDFGPCKCKSCITKSTVKDGGEITSSNLSTGNGKTQPKSFQRTGSLPLKSNSENSKSKPTSAPIKSKSIPYSASSSTKKMDQSESLPPINSSKNDPGANCKKPFSFLQSLFKSAPVETSGIDGNVKQQESSSTFDINRLSTINEEKTQRDSVESGRRHSDSASGSISLDDQISVLSLPFLRPRSGSTCCQSFQFMEMMTVGEKKMGLNDLEPFGVFDGFDGISVAGNYIDLKQDTAESRQIIKSRLGIKSDSKPELLIQWKRGPILGRGAFGTVWCGLTMAGEMIAVKQAEVSSIDVQKAQKEYEKIQQEIDLLKSLSHKNIVGYLGTSFQDKVVSIFMQFIPGGSITSILKKFGPLAEPVIACYTKQILEGVEYLHSKNVVHRDLKGSNVMLMPNAVIKLIDFGCAKRAMNLTKSNAEILKSMKGTPYWMAPEVMNETGHGKKSDIWSIGCTVFEMATTRPPWSHLNRYAALLTIATGPAPPPQLPNKFSTQAKRFVNDCLIREPEKRPDASALLTCKFILQNCQERGNRILDSRGVPTNSSRRH